MGLARRVTADLRAWSRNEPNNWGGQGACVVLNWKDPDGWVDQSCDYAIPFICEHAGGRLGQ